MPRRYSYDDDRAYDAWLEAREAAEEAEAQEAWEAEVDEHCECVYEAGKENYRYYDWDWVKPLTQCAWHAERAAARAAEEAARVAAEQRRQQEEHERQLVAARKRAADAAVVAEELGIELPEGYVAPLRSPPVYNPTHKWRVEMLHVGKLLYILDGQGLAEPQRLQIISQIFTYLSYPENIGLVYDNAKFRTVVIAKINEFRSDARAEPIKEVLERMEAALKSPPV